MSVPLVEVFWLDQEVVEGSEIASPVLVLLHVWGLGYTFKARSIHGIRAGLEFGIRQSGSPIVTGALLHLSPKQVPRSFAVIDEVDCSVFGLCCRLEQGMTVHTGDTFWHAER